MEEWKKIIIDGKETFYSVSNYGNVRNDSKGTLLTGSIANNGYRMVHLRYRIDKNCSVHRLVMKAFLPCELMDDLQINHKDGNKLNNHLENLEWCTALQNIRHSFDAHLQSKEMLPCHVYDLEGNYIESFINSLEAAKQYPVTQSSINRCLREEYQHCKQWQFKTYKKEKIDPWYFNNRKEKRVYLYDINGELITIYPSQKEAAYKLGVNPKTIGSHLKNNKPLLNFVLSNIPL